MDSLKDILQNLQNRLFDSIVNNRLVYNTCWEDPRIDRRLLEIDRNSRIVMLTSAGCNALDYLLDDPDVIHTVDANPAQTALLELKMTLFEAGDYELLFDFFGRGSHPGAPLLYEKRLRSNLSDRSRKYWDRKINFFSSTSSEPSFYFRGTSGRVALMAYRRIKRKGLYGDVLHLLDASSLREQQYYFREIESQVWSGFHRWLLQRNATMAMLGVPAGQRNLIDEDVEGGLYSFIRESLRKVFTERPIGDNYFWRVYLTGSYTPGCCPNYLKETHFRFLRDRIDRLRTHTGSLIRFLEHHPGRYTHFVLLDHQDWMALTDPEMLKYEWELLLDNAASGARILFRSAGRRADFLPDFVAERVEFMPEQTEPLHKKDRVGTYGSTHLAIVP